MSRGLYVDVSKQLDTFGKYGVQLALVVSTKSRHWRLRNSGVISMDCPVAQSLHHCPGGKAEQSLRVARFVAIFLGATGKAPGVADAPAPHAGYLP